MDPNPFRGSAPLLALALAFPAGASLALLAGEGWPAALLLPLLALPPLLLRGRHLTAALCVALAAGAWGGAASIPPAPGRVAPFLDREILLEGLLGEARPADDGWSATAGEVRLSIPGGTEELALARAALRVTGGAAPVRLPVRVRAFGRLVPAPHRTNPVGLPPEWRALSGGYRYRFHAFADRLVLLPAGNGASATDPFRRARGRTRDWILSAAGRGEGALYLLSLATGDVPPPGHPLCDLMRRTGLAHLLAISGVNVAVFHILCSAALRFLSWLLLRGGRGRGGAADGRTACTVLSLAASWGYVLLAGAPIPAVRSAAALTLAVAALRLGGRVSAATCLVLASLVALATEPWALLSPSFQLSYVACAFLVLSFAGRGGGEREGGAGGWRKRVVHRLLQAAEGCTVAFCGTLPVAAAHFGAVPFLSIPWNLLFAPLLGTAGVAGAVAAVAGGALGCTILAVPVRRIAEGLGATISLLRAVSRDGAGYAEVAPAGWGACAFFTAAAFAAGILLRRSGRPAWPAPAASALLFLAWIHLPFLSLPPDRLEAVLLDAGKGASAVLFLPGGRTVVADCGSALRGDTGRRLLVPFLRSRGVRRVDLLVLSHPHEDHAGGAEALAKAFPVTETWIPEGTDRAEFGRAVPPGASVRPVRTGERFGTALGEVVVRGTGGEGRGANRRCLMLEARDRCLSLWLPGDAEGGPSAWNGGDAEEGEGRRRRVLVLPHHGSRGADPEGWARRCSPAASVTQLPDCLDGGNLVLFGQIYSLREGACRAVSTGRSARFGYATPHGALGKMLLGTGGNPASH